MSFSIAVLTAVMATLPALAQQKAPIVAPTDVPPGTRGYGLSVFSGTAPERFEVEVLGVMRNLNPGTDFLLARLSGHGLETSGVVAGMSGSPVFFEGRLAGAVSFGWSFSNEAIAGITPIAPMRELATLPAGRPIAPMPSVPLQQLMQPDLSDQALDRHLRHLAQLAGSSGDSPLHWSTVGFNDRLRSRLGHVLGPIAPAGTADDLGTDLEPGSAVAGVLIDGDLRMAFTGTVTERLGDDILAFGHPFQGLGPVRLPMATAEVVTVISSQSNSFKLANIGPVVGAFDQDRMVGMAGRVGATAPTVPMVVRVHGEPTREYRLQVADLPQMTPGLAASAILQTLEAARHLQGSQTLTLRAILQIEGHEPLEIEQYFEGDSATLSSAIYVLQVLSYVYQNPDEQAKVTGLEIDFEQESRPMAAQLLTAHADRLKVHAGESVELRLDLREYRGEERRQTVTVAIPEGTDDGPYYLFVGDGASVDALRLQMEPHTPSDFRESLELLRSLHSARDFVVLGVSAGAGLLVNGRSLPELPASMRSIWRASGPQASKALKLAIRHESSRTLQRALRGAARIDLRVVEHHGP